MECLVQSDYLHAVFRPENFDGTVKRAITHATRLVENYKVEAIAFSGVSGASLGYILGYTLGVPLMCIRKPRERAHYYGTLEGCTSARRYMIVDDFIATGDTVRNIMETITKECNDSVCVVMMMFNQDDRQRTFYHRDVRTVIDGDHPLFDEDCRGALTISNSTQTCERAIPVHSCKYDVGCFPYG
jgi:adenine/guanine phosphoribosyltransferase-like PRPP-binding protein